MTQTIGKYELLDVIGRGGFAVVYKARDTRLNRQVALKVLHPHWASDPSFAARFQREASAAARLNHPNIVTVHDADEVEGQLYIAMTYLPGETLEAHLQAAGRLALADALPLLAQIAQALDYAHARGLVHRDIKPSNVMVHDGHVTLMDFGLVKALAESQALTSIGTLLGSPEYMAPEQADPNRADEIGPATDLYALGVLAYRLLAGRVPFPGNTPGTLNAHMNLTPPDPQDFVKDLPPEVTAGLCRMLAKAPADRFPTAQAFVDRLRSIQAAEEQRRQQAQHTVAPSKPPRDKFKIPASLWQGALAVFLILVCGMTAGPAVVQWLGQAARAPTATPTRRPPTETPTPAPTKTPTPRPPTPRPTPRPTATPETPGAAPACTNVGQTWTRPADGMTMVCVPGGSFQMGSEEGPDNEQPVHTVTLDACWLDQTEVTNAQYAAFLNARGNQSEGGATWLDISDEDSLIAGTEGNYQPVEGYADHPVIEVSWYGAQAYCQWAGGQLPSEAQWEYAARGPEALVYPWGNDWREAVANCTEDDCKDGYETTAPVGSFPEGASWVGAQDMAGNVWEWVADWYAEDYYSQAPENNPPGPTEGQHKVLRGGAWNSDTDNVRSADRSRVEPSITNYYVGFRCLLPQPLTTRRER